MKAVLTPERLVRITTELEKGKVANYPGLLKASHEALREQAERRMGLLQQIIAQGGLAYWHSDAVLLERIRAEVEDADKT